MSTCPRCGKQIQEDDKFCGFCGFNLTIEQSTSSFTQQELKVSDIRLNLGMVYLKQGKYKLALENFKKVLAQDPNHPMAGQMIEQVQTAMEM